MTLAAARGECPIVVFAGAAVRGHQAPGTASDGGLTVFPFDEGHLGQDVALIEKMIIVPLERTATGWHLGADRLVVELEHVEAICERLARSGGHDPAPPVVIDAIREVWLGDDRAGLFFNVERLDGDESGRGGGGRGSECRWHCVHISAVVADVKLDQGPAREATVVR